MKIITWGIRIIIFVLLLVILLNNMQEIQFNFYGIYFWHLPLIVFGLIALAIGLVCGLSVGLMRTFKLKSQIRVLQESMNKSGQAQL